MKLLRYGAPGAERPAVLGPDMTIRDLSRIVLDLSGDTLSDESLDNIRTLDFSTLPEVSAEERVGPCVGNSRNFICVGLNYSDHAAEAGLNLPEEPVFFLKATSSICGPYDDITLPEGSKTTDWEVELGFVIGKGGMHISADVALEYVAGYCVVNDISERTYQFENAGQWVKAKSCFSFGPVGPWLVTRDEVSDPANLDLRLDVDGERFQDGNTSKMVFGVPEIIAYLSRFMLLMPGDIIATGTPPGVGLGQKPNPIFLRSGQMVSAQISGLGEQRQYVRNQLESATGKPDGLT